VRKVLTLVIALLVISVITPAITHASATRTGVTGTMTLSVSFIGDINITKSGIMHQVGARASGTVASDSSELSGDMDIELSANFNLNTGEGVAFGSFVITNAEGSFEGMFRVKDTGFINFEGTLEGHGTDAYRGKMVQLRFGGTDLYRGGYTGPDGLTGTCEGFILSPKGT
jgi:hypothetical protein